MDNLKDLQKLLLDREQEEIKMVNNKIPIEDIIKYKIETLKLQEIALTRMHYLLERGA